MGLAAENPSDGAYNGEFTGLHLHFMGKMMTQSDFIVD
jgi:hypothetical protein